MEWSAVVKNAILNGNQTLKLDAEKQQALFKERVEALEKQISGKVYEIM